MQKQITVAIITRNRDKLLAKCLASLEKQTLKCSELLVVDNASKDQTRNVVKQFKKTLPIHYLYESRIGIPFARNRALKEAKGEILAFIDDDCEATPNWVEEMIKAHKKYPHAAAVQGSLETMNVRSIFAILSQRNYDHWLYVNTKESNKLSMINTSNVSFKKRVLIKLAISFDTSFYRFYCGEDTDIACHLLAKKQDIMYVPAAVVHFKSRTTLFSFLGRRFRAGAANILLAYKWPRIFPPSRKAPDQFIAQNVVLNWSQRILLGIVYAFSKRAYLSGKIIEEVRMLQTQLLHKNSSSNEKRRQMLFLAVGIIRQCRDATFPLYLKFLGQHGLYLLIAFFFLQRKERQSLEVFISQRKSLRPNKTNRSVSVAVVTRNRASLLYGCLSSLSRQTVLPDEVLVIDNASTDKTKKVALSFKQLLPIRYIYEPKIGIPFVRNRALKEVGGEILAFLDDGCTATRAWIEEMTKAHIAYPRAAAIQGRSIFIPSQTISSKLTQIYYDKWLIHNKTAKNEIYILDTENVSFKKRILKKYTLTFDESFERGSDIDFAKQLLNCKQKIFFHERALVYSSIDKGFLNFIKKRFSIGKANARIEAKWCEKHLPTVRYEPIYARLKQYKPFMQVAKIAVHRLPLACLLYILDKTIVFLGKIIGRSNIMYSLLGYNTILKKQKPLLGSKKSIPSVSVLINTRNRSVDLRECLLSLKNQTVAPQEIIIVDNNSTDNTKKIIDYFAKILPITYVFESKIGLPHARNIGLSYVKKDIVCFLDDDCQASPAWIEELVATHMTDPSIGAVEGNSISIPENNLYALLSQFLRDEWFGENLSYDKRLLVADTKNLSVRYAFIKKHHLRFKDELYEAGGEDVDFGRQLLLFKKSIVYNPNAIVYHREPTSLPQFLIPTYEKGYGYALLKEYWTSFYPSRNFFLLYFERIIRLVTHPMLRRKLYIIPLLVLLYMFRQLVFRQGVIAGEKGLYSNIPKLMSIIGLRAKKKIRTTVAIVTRNRATLLRHCLSSLEKQTVVPHEVLVIDNASTDQTKELALSFSKVLPIRYIYEAKIGIPHARNRALKEARGEILAFIDDDCEASTAWVGEMMGAHFIYPRAAAIQGRSIAIPMNSIFALLSQKNHEYWIHKHLKKNNELLILDTKNASFKKDILIKLNLSFDKKINGGEDADMAKQLLVKGRKIIYYPSALIFFLARLTLKDFLVQRYRYGVLNAKIAYKWYPYITPFKKLSLSYRLLPWTSWYKYIVVPFVAYVSKETLRFGQLIEETKIHYGELARCEEKNIKIKKKEKILLLATALTFKDRGGLKSKLKTLLSRLLVYYFLKINFIKNIKPPFDFLPNRIENLLHNVPKLPHASIAIITRNRDEFLYYALRSLAKQTILPFEILVIDNKFSDYTLNVVRSFSEYLPVRYFHEPRIGIPFARNRALKEARGEILAFIDDDCEASPSWFESILEGHEKYPHAIAIQGMSISAPKKNFFSIIAQFNRQTWVRDHMIGDRNLYWDWIVGRLQKDFEVTLFDTGNVSIKLDHVKRLHITFDENFPDSSDDEFGKYLLSEEQHIVYNPKTLAFHHERDNLREFLIQRRHQGRIFIRQRARWPEEYFSLQKRTFVKSFISFTYYCLINEYYLKLPFLIGVFILQHMAFLRGASFERKIISDSFLILSHK